MHDAVAWLDAIDPRRAIQACGARTGRLTELPSAGVRVPRGFAITADAYRRHCAKTGLDGIIDTALSGLGSDIDRLARQYTGQPYPQRDRRRISAWIAVDGWHGWGAQKDSSRAE